MTELVIVLVLLYCLIAALVFLGSLISYFDMTMVQFKKFFAVGIVMAPVWPLIVVAVILWLINRRISSL